MLTLPCYCAIRFTDSRGIKDCLVYVNTFKVKFLYEMLDRAEDIFYKVSGFTVVWQVDREDEVIAIPRECRQRSRPAQCHQQFFDLVAGSSGAFSFLRGCACVGRTS